VTKTPTVERNSEKENCPSKFERVVDTANKLFQIAAIIVAGIWAGWTWYLLTAPSLKTGLAVSVELGKSEWDASSNACVNEIPVTVENLGQRTIEVSRVDYEVFKAKRTRLESANMVSVEDGPPPRAERTSLKQGHLESFVGRYAPKVKTNWTLTVFASRNPDEELWFEAEAFDNDNNRLDYGYTWWKPCQDDDQHGNSND
jgi:hypothetical protein